MRTSLEESPALARSAVGSVEQPRRGGDVAIRAEGLGKQYRLGEDPLLHNTLRDALVHGWRARWSALRAPARGRQEGALFWALRDVDFEITAGEAVGVVGSNGAGKSTLLKLLARITEPTEGGADLYGRVASLLEVGTGFHSELTGRENVYLSGAILGMHRAEITRSFDAIVEFSEVEPFLDTPIKRYSSGMRTRLAFAVAAHLEAEILLVDEVLAVGDAAFQRKCVAKMREIAGAGRTILFVSHNAVAVQSLCPRTLWLADGRLVADGATQEVLSAYLRSLTQSVRERSWPEAALPGGRRTRLCRARVLPEGGSACDPLDVRAPFWIELELHQIESGAPASRVLHVYDEHDVLLFSASSGDVTSVRHPGTLLDRCRIPGDLLNDGRHRVELLLVDDDEEVVMREPHLLVFDVLDDGELRRGWHGEWLGAVRPRLEWRTEESSPESRLRS